MVEHGNGLLPYQYWGCSFGDINNWHTGTADFNGDGKADVWQLYRSPSTQERNFKVRLSSGTALYAAEEWGSVL